MSDRLVSTNRISIGDVVLAGQKLGDSAIEKASLKNQVVVGPGLRKVGDGLMITKCGILRCQTAENRPPVYWVDALGKRYSPAAGDHVVGIVTKKLGDFYRVDVRAADQALLSYLAFESATKKNRPDINVGDVVYGRMVVVSPDVEPELVCVNSLGRRENMGVLPTGGFVFRASLHLCRKLLGPKCPMLAALGQAFKYESAVGLNGLIWVKSNDPVSTIAISNAILGAETMTAEEIDTFCANLC